MKSTGHFYIGVTDNFARREHQHFLNVKSVITHSLLTGKIKGEKIYQVIGNEVYKKRFVFSNIDNVIKESYTISIKFVSSCPIEIKNRETSTLKRHRNSKLLLNTALKSTYAPDKTSQRITSIRG